jgi:predicted nucleic acid-binding protein
LIVADSSFLVQAILRDAELLAPDRIVTVDLALHEVTIAVWKHEHVIKDIKQGISFVKILLELIDSGEITLVTPTRKMVERAYHLTAKHKTSFYDCIFVALAVETGLGLRTMDREQEKVMKAEKP